VKFFVVAGTKFSRDGNPTSTFTARAPWVAPDLSQSRAMSLVERRHSREKGAALRRKVLERALPISAE
jgi:hypothetical protein